MTIKQHQARHSKLKRLLRSHDKLMGKVEQTEIDIAKTLSELTGFDFDVEFSVQMQPQEGLTILFNHLASYDGLTDEQKAFYQEQECLAIPIGEFVGLIERGYLTKEQLLPHFYI